MNTFFELLFLVIATSYVFLVTKNVFFDVYYSNIYLKMCADKIYEISNTTF